LNEIFNGILDLLLEFFLCLFGLIWFLNEDKTALVVVGSSGRDGLEEVVEIVLIEAKHGIDDKYRYIIEYDSSLQLINSD